MPSQRPFFLSTFFAAFRQQPSSAALSSSTAAVQQSRHGSTAAGTSTDGTASVSSAAAAAVAASHRLNATRSHGSTTGGIPIAGSGSSNGHSAGHSHSNGSSSGQTSPASPGSTGGYGTGYGYFGNGATNAGGGPNDEPYYGVVGYNPAAYAATHQAPGMPLPNRPGGQGSGGRRRGSDSSSEGFRDVLGADKWYIGGRTAAGEERFFKLGVVRRVRSGDRLSLDRLSL